MRDVIYLLFHLLNITTTLIQPGGSKAIIAENLIRKQQLIIQSIGQTELGVRSLIFDSL